MVATQKPGSTDWEPRMINRGGVPKASYMARPRTDHTSSIARTDLPFHARIAAPDRAICAGSSERTVQAAGSGLVESWMRVMSCGSRQKSDRSTYCLNEAASTKPTRRGGRVGEALLVDVRRRKRFASVKLGLCA